MRAVIYARYSSDHQREASIEDQVRICKERIAREGWNLEGIYHDKALSGASLLRPGYQAMLIAAMGGQADVVVAEALDRLSRDQEDVAGLFKRLRFAGVRIVTLAEGEISELHVGLKGTMNALFLRDLAAKTHRGMTGRVQAGKSGGGLCYGYDVVRALDERGERLRGDRVINPAQSAIVRRIFEMFAAGSSPIAIARALNAESLPGPESRAWRDTTIRGHALRGTGILRNELYVGRLIWNRLRYVRDPNSGKRISRLNPESAWVRHEVPELRIIDEAVWTEVQHRLRIMRVESGADEPDRKRFCDRRRSIHVLTQKVHCGCCGGQMSNIGQDYLACSAARRQGICPNTQSIKRGVVEELVLDALRTRLMAPELVAEFIKAFTAEWNCMVAEGSADQEAAEREQAAVERKLSGLIDAIAEGFRAPGLQSKLDALESRRAALLKQRETPVAAIPRFHPNLSAIYRSRVAHLQDALRSDPDGREALEAVRGLIERVNITPSVTGRGHEIELIGEIAGMMQLASGPERRKAGTGVPACDELSVRSMKVVAGVGFEPTTFRL